MNSRYVICDIEATGLHEEKEIIEIALITFQDDKVVDVYETLINPLLPVSEFIRDLTTISTRDLINAPKFYEVAEAIRMRLEGGIFVSHKIDFDLNLLKKKYQEMGQELNVKSFCTLKVAQHEIPGLKNYNLDALCSFFNIKIRERHRAIGDARATLELFRELQNLRLKVRPVVRFLPHHEKSLKDIPAKAGLLKFKNEVGKTVRLESSFNMHKTARGLLEIKPENRELLVASGVIEAEVTGSALIAEFRKLLIVPFRPNWMIGLEEHRGERRFTVCPFRKGTQGLWYFVDYLTAKKKLKRLQQGLQTASYIYREGGKSKEEILKHNQQVELLSREAKFPSENLIIVGEGRTLGEKSVVLVRDGHVFGHGYAMDATEEAIYGHPEAFLTRRFSRHLGADLAAMHYLRVLKNVRNKKEGWRSLSLHAKVSL